MCWLPVRVTFLVMKRTGTAKLCVQLHAQHAEVFRIGDDDQAVDRPSHLLAGDLCGYSMREATGTIVLQIFIPKRGATMRQTLDEKQLKALLHKMQIRYSTLRDEVRVGLAASDNENYRKLAGEVADTGEESLADLLVDVRLAEIDRDVEELKDIDAAMARMHSGDYGICIDCGAPIPYARLQAYPIAKRCEPCQRKHERTFRSPGAPTL